VISGELGQSSEGTKRGNVRSFQKQDILLVKGTDLPHLFSVSEPLCIKSPCQNSARKQGRDRMASRSGDSPGCTFEFVIKERHPGIFHPVCGKRHSPEVMSEPLSDISLSLSAHTFLVHQDNTVTNWMGQCNEASSRMWVRVLFFLSVA
jgi:hypothetical protein